eukprot:880653-Pleurochrysis_carterae.AAC.1
MSRALPLYNRRSCCIFKLLYRSNDIMKTTSRRTEIDGLTTAAKREQRSKAKKLVIPRKKKQQEEGKDERTERGANGDAGVEKWASSAKERTNKNAGKGKVL